MLKSLPIRWRLSLWYFTTLATILVVVGVGSRFALRLSLDRAINQDLKYSLAGLSEYIAAGRPANTAELKTVLAPISGLNDLFLVYDADGTLLCASAALARRHVTMQAPSLADSVIRFRAGGHHRFNLRMAYQQIAIGGGVVTLEVAEPLRKFEDALHGYTGILWFALPAVLLLSTVGGFWLSSRALRPVDRMIENARAIKASDLSRRLDSPPTRDELWRLSETLNEMLDRIEAAFRQVRRFTADASHELRAPITLIRTAAEFSLRRDRSREELVDSMSKILREAVRTSTLLEDLLLLARADSGQNGIELRPMDLTPLLKDLAEQAAALAASKEIAVTCVPPASSLIASADASSLRRLLLILVDNAIKYTPPRGCVMIAARRCDDGALISITDTGPGIGPDDLPHIFERFWRADKVRSRDEGGTGLGLSIAQEIAAGHRAVLNVESTPGQGSTFTVLLPAA